MYEIGMPIITDGLMVYLDARNPRSYSGTGDTVYDLSGNSRHFRIYAQDTVTNPPIGYNSTEGYFVFNASHKMQPIVLENYLLDDFTIEMWIKKSPDCSGMLASSLLWQGAGHHGWRIESNNTNVSFLIWVDSGNAVASVSQSLVPNSWNRIAVTKSFSELNIWVNDQRATVTNTGTSIWDFSVDYNNMSIGNYIYQNNTWATMNMAIYRMYNMVLTENDLTYNYEVQRKRFGI
jgi:hypothetical protein